MKRMSTAVLMLALLGTSREGVSQEVRSVALDRETKKPVADLRVSLLNRRREELDTARTAQDGSFTLRAKEGGKFFIQVQHAGQAAEESDAIFLEKDQTLNDTLYVTPARLLQGIDIVIGREIFRLLGVTISSMAPRQLILPEDIDEIRGRSQNASDIVMRKGPPFLRVIGLGTGRICYQLYGGDCARVYLNGQPMQTNTDIPASELEAVAVIPARSAQTTLGNNSGVVMLWTRGMLKSAR